LQIVLDSSLADKIARFQKLIIEWYSRYGDRWLPWRRTSDPWAILTAAFLLRKTTVKQVVSIYGDFLQRFPKPENLLSASTSDVEEAIRPLGIEHQRAQHLRQLAEHIVKRFAGRIPCDREKLKELPGVGDYIASEVLLSACNKPAPLLDRNMIRVIERVFGIKSLKKRPHQDEMMWSFAELLVPKDPQQARDFNYGVLDFARKVCTARNPNCRECPVKEICTYFKSSMPNEEGLTSTSTAPPSE